MVVEVHDGERILIVGALLSAGLLASLLASRVRVPGLVLFLGRRHGRRQRRRRLDRLRRLRAGAHGRDRRPRAHPVRGRPGRRLPGDPARPRPVADARGRRDAADRRRHRAGRGVAVRLRHDRGPARSARSSRATDGAAIFALLRGSTLRRRLARTLEGESGLNDPIAILLVLGFIEGSTNPGYGSPTSCGCSSRQLAIGGAVGLAVGCLSPSRCARRGWPPPGLYPVATLAAVALAFGAADTLHGSGFLAVYLAGLMLGSADDPGQADDRHLPRGPGLGRPAVDVPRARPARVPVRPRRGGAGGHGAGARPRASRAAAGRRRGHRAVRLQRRASRRCWAGRACAARSRSCWRRSRSSRASRAATSSSTSSSSSSCCRRSCRARRSSRWPGGWA